MASTHPLAAVSTAAPSGMVGTGAARPLLALLPLLLVPAGVGVFVDGTLAGAKGLWYGGAVVALTVAGLAGVGRAAQAWLERDK